MISFFHFIKVYYLYHEAKTKVVLQSVRKGFVLLYQCRKIASNYLLTKCDYNITTAKPA